MTAPRFVAARKAPGCPIEIMVYEGAGEGRTEARVTVVPLSPGAALALVESLIIMANQRLTETGRMLRDVEGDDDGVAEN